MATCPETYIIDGPSRAVLFARAVSDGTCQVARLPEFAPTAGIRSGAIGSAGSTWSILGRRFSHRSVHGFDEVAGSHHFPCLASSDDDSAGLSRLPIAKRLATGTKRHFRVNL